MKICPIQITICNDQSLKVFKKLNWSNNNNFVSRLKFYNYLNIVPIFRKLNESSFIKNELKDLKLEELNNKTISKMADLSEHNLIKKSIGIIRDEKWFKWRILDCPYKKDIYIFNFKENFIVTRMKLKNDLDIELMNKSCEKLMSYKDFTSFSKVHTDVNNFNCNVTKAFWIQKNHQIIFKITANRFLRNMVRAVVGTMLLVGQKKLSILDFCKIIETKDRSSAGPSVKAKGLFLVNLDYKNE